LHGNIEGSVEGMMIIRSHLQWLSLPDDKVALIAEATEATRKSYPLYSVVINPYREK